jgi:protease II
MPITFVSAETGKLKRFPATSPTGDRIAWVEKDLKTEKITIQMISLKRKKAAAEILKSEEGAEYQDLFWHPDTDQIYYSVLSRGEKKYHLETYNIQKHCTHILFKGKESLVQPVVSTSRKPKIAFVRLLDDRKQIYMVDLPVDLGPCLEEATAAKLDK